MIVVLFTMKNDKWKVFFPAIFTMAGLHVMSVAFGTLFPLLFSRNTIVYFSIVLFLFFGVMMLYEAYHLQPKTSEEKIGEMEGAFIEKKDAEATKSSGVGKDFISKHRNRRANKSVTTIRKEKR